MTSSAHVLIASIALCLCLGSAPATAAESYDNCTGFIDSVPATISTQGTWCLRDDLSTAMTTGNAITVATNNVAIDCNGFKLGGLAAGEGSSARGIHADDRQNVTVRQCNVRGFFYGISLNGGAGHLVEDNRLDNNLYTGIFVDDIDNDDNDSRVLRNVVLDTGGTAHSQGYGIWASADVADNTVSGVFATAASTFPVGILIQGPGSEARDNRVRGLVVAGEGSARGIRAHGTGIRIEGNQVAAAVATFGSGIYGKDDATLCSNNAVTGFSTAYDGCEFVIGNLPGGP